MRTTRLALVAFAVATATAASSAQQSVTTGAVINAVHFFAGVASPVSVGDRWTTIAVAAFGLYRWDNGTSDTIISIGFSEDEDDCGDSSSMYRDLLDSCGPLARRWRHVAEPGGKAADPAFRR